MGHFKLWIISDTCGEMAWNRDQYFIKYIWDSSAAKSLCSFQFSSLSLLCNVFCVIYYTTYLGIGDISLICSTILQYLSFESPRDRHCGEGRHVYPGFFLSRGQTDTRSEHEQKIPFHMTDRPRISHKLSQQLSWVLATLSLKSIIAWQYCHVMATPITKRDWLTLHWESARKVPERDGFSSFNL